MSEPDHFSRPDMTRERLRYLVRQLAQRIRARRPASAGAARPANPWLDDVTVSLSDVSSPLLEAQPRPARQRALLRRVLATGSGRNLGGRRPSRLSRSAGRARGRR